MSRQLACIIDAMSWILLACWYVAKAAAVIAAFYALLVLVAWYVGRPPVAFFGG